MVEWYNYHSVRFFHILISHLSSPTLKIMISKIPDVILLSIASASFFEWALHRFFMHRPFLGFFRYPFTSHALVHHGHFKSDHTYHLDSHPQDKRTIPMAWWNGPVLILVATALFTPFFSWVTGLWWPWTSIVVSLTFLAYYGAYEYSHWCMHLPKRRHVERSWFFRRLNGHHLLHHRYMNKNFNVVLPLADLCLGTLLLRSKIQFAQPFGPAVPNVRPR